MEHPIWPEGTVDVSALITSDDRCSGLQFDDTPGKSVCEVHRKECLYSGFKSRKFQCVRIMGSLKINVVTWTPSTDLYTEVPWLSRALRHM
jgi:hypothetical protein